MGQVSKPHVPDGPLRTYIERLHALHVAAGQPSMRQLQRRTRTSQRPGGVDPTTIHAAFTATRPARWEVVEAIVRALGGSVEEFTRLWHGARTATLSEPPPVTDGHAAGSAPVPRELPLSVPAFAGRDDAMAALDAAEVIASVSGTAGVGKTALAIHWAHRAADRFPDGQLYIDLRGYDAEQPVAPADALAQFLRALGVAPRDVPYELAERAARYRSMLAGRRILLVLDNARSTEQVRPLLPGSSSCFALVTSRASLAGLVARHGASRIDLDVLTPAEAEHLLRHLLGARCRPEPVTALARLCAYLPLALRIAAELISARPEEPLADLVTELDRSPGRLDALAADDDRTALATVFSWSYRYLPERVAELFRLLGVAPCPDIDVPAAAALADDAPGATRHALDALARAHLVDRRPSGRYTMHDLMREYANRLAVQADPENGRRAAVTRLFDHLLATTGDAAEADDQVWLDANRDALVRCVVHAARHGWPVHATRLGAAMGRYLLTGAHHADAVAVHTAALDGARQVDDHVGAAAAMVDLGNVYWRWARYEEAADAYRGALRAFAEAGDARRQARTLTNLGAAYWQLGRYEEAARTCEQAVDICAGDGDKRGEARALDNLGAVWQRRGRDRLAEQCHSRALALLRELGDRGGQARALDNLGATYQRLRLYDRATEHHERALAILRDIGDRTGVAKVRDNLGTLCRRQGRHAEAVEHHRDALEIARSIGGRADEVSTLNGLGEARCAASQPVEARECHQRALAIAVEIGDRYEQARALDGIGHALHAIGETAAARASRRRAVEIYAALGVPEATAHADAALQEV